MNAGAGHNALRDSFAASLEQADAGRLINPVVWTSADRFVDSFYAFCVRHLPRSQGTIVKLSGWPLALAAAMRLSPWMQREATDLLRSESFDLLVTTHPLQALIFGRARHLLGLASPVVCAVPDYGVPAPAYYPLRAGLRPDALIVMEESTLDHYRGLGVPENRLHLSGFHTREPFVRVGARLRNEPRLAVRERLRAEVATSHPRFLRFRLDRPTLLFLGGSAWTAKTAPVLRAVLAEPDLRALANLVVVAGRDAAFEARVRALEGENLHVFGFVAPAVLAGLMGLADALVLGSLAPALLQELLEVGLGPLLLLHVIPGSEWPHVRYIESQRLGVYEPHTPHMVRLIREMLGLLPASERLTLARDGFRERARFIRTLSVERALRLPQFLLQMAGIPALPPRGRRGRWRAQRTPPL